MQTKMILILIVILFFAFNCNALACNYLITKFDIKMITKNLPLKNKELSKSDNGRMRHRWNIACGGGKSCGQFEVIGDDKKDVDKVCWTCSEYDTNGARIKPINKDKFCHHFFGKVLKNIIDCPDELANQLIIQGERIKPQAAIYTTVDSDISVETDGEYYAIRRMSRAKKDLIN